MPSEENPYDVLDVTRSASAKELKRAFYKKVREHPPERDTERYQDVVDAYEMLKKHPRHSASDRRSTDRPSSTVSSKTASSKTASSNNREDASTSGSPTDSSFTSESPGVNESPATEDGQSGISTWAVIGGIVVLILVLLAMF